MKRLGLSSEDKLYFDTHLVPLLSRLIKNRCVNDGSISSGNEIKNGMLLTSFFKEAAIDSVLLTPKGDEYKNISSRASIVATVNGSSLSPTVYGLMGHLDVVPANSKKWSFDPFSGEWDNEFLYGRGALDMLGQVAIMATSLCYTIKKFGRPKESIKFIGVADEEADGLLGASRILKEHKELASCHYLISELGGYFIDENHIAISTSEKGVLRLQLETFGTPSHGSMPFKGDSAINKISDAINKLNGLYQNPIYTNEAIKMIQNMPLAKDQIDNLLNEPQVYKTLEEIYNQKPGLAKLIHSALFLTISVGVVQGGTKVNIIPDYASAHVDIRLPHGVTNLMCIEEIRKALGDQVKITQLEYFPSNSSSIDTPLMEEIKLATKKFYPDAKLVPVVPAGVSDARYWRCSDALKAAYGFCLFSQIS